MKCEKCGEPLPEDAVFCRNCGFKLAQKESFFKKNQRAVIFIAIIIIAAIITFAAFSYVTNHEYQTVNVGSVSFKIPSEFRETNSTFSNGEADDVILLSKTWESENDTIMIAVMQTNNVNVGANDVNSVLGGEKQTLMGYIGSLHEIDGSYYFSFVRHNILITVYASDMGLFDRIEVL